MDTLSKDARKRVMQANKSKGTSPEMRVRKALHALGMRFRLHRKDLPGKPDLVLRRWNLCIFVHGCFWHQHPDCSLASRPKSNQDYWEPKLRRNKERDKLHQIALEKLGWDVEVIWECETRRSDALERRIREVFF